MNSRQTYNEAHPDYLGWQADWPLFVKSPILKVDTKVFKRGDYFPWAEMNLEAHKIAHMYTQKMVYHDATKAKETGEGDRLGEINNRDLRSIVNLMNTELKKSHCATEQEFKKRRCRQSNVVDTQRRFIRQFLSRNPYMGEYFLSVRERFLDKNTPQE